MDKKLKKQHLRSSAVRTAVLIFIFLLTTTLGILHQYGGITPVGVDALCPFGGVESLWQLISTDTFIPRIALSSFILLGGIIILTLLFNRSFCGNICPLGYLQELFELAGRRLLKKSFTIPEKADRFLRYIKYAVFIVVTFLSWYVADLVIRPYDPWATYHHLWSGELLDEFLIGFIVLIISLAGSLLYKRFFCKYLCPMGALLGILGKIGLYKVQRKEETCIHCSACSTTCPVNIDVEKEERITSAECLSCNRCVNVCPVNDTLNVSFRQKRMSPLTVTLVTFLLMSSLVGITTITGHFNWQVQKLEGAEQGEEFNIDEIRGRHSFEELSHATGISKEEFMEHFSITEEQFHAPIKDTVHAPGSQFDVDDIRAFIASKSATVK